MLFCDFCGGEFLEKELARLRAISFVSYAEEKILGYVPPVGSISDGDWAACAACDALIKEEAWEALANRGLECHEAKYGKILHRKQILEYLKEVHQEFRRARL